ncbi:MAG: hypothetical protein ACRBK7_10205 [Acidimicrobiales bacterium]
MDRKQQALPITCHNFSDIRRRPLVIGKLDQVRLPFVVTMPQLAIGAIVFALLYLSKPIWGAVMSDRLHIVVFVAVPVLVAQQVSRTTVEGRPLSKAILGLFRLWTAPRYGTINGRRQGPPQDSAVRLQPLLDEPDRRPYIPRDNTPRGRARRTGIRRLQLRPHRRRPRDRHASAHHTSAPDAGGRRTFRVGDRGGQP